MSSIITIGFLDRTRVCLQTEFTPPLADDERRELLIHAALLTGRAFASLPQDRQRTFAGVLREWDAAGFETCPLQIVAGDPMACRHRFAWTFLAPVREYALATIGCDREAGGIDYFLPMAAAAYLRQLADTDRDPKELFRPALALCAAAMIHPITVDNHFQMAAASLPKVGPIIDRTVISEPTPAEPDLFQDRPFLQGPAENSHRSLRETRRSLIVSACLAALVIVLGVHYLSTREPKAGGETAAVRDEAKPQAVPKQVAPQPAPKQSQEGVGAHGGAPIPEGGSPSAPTPEPFRSVVGAPHAAPPPAPKPLSPKTRAYLRKIRDIAENSLAQVEVMLAASDQKGIANDDLSETLDYGARRLQSWRRQFAALVPPASLVEQHREIGRIMMEMGRIAQATRPRTSKPDSGAIRDRLSRMHEELAHVLNEAEVF